MSAFGEEGTPIVSGGRVLYSTSSRREESSFEGGGKRVSFTVVRSGRGPLK